VRDSDDREIRELLADGLLEQLVGHATPDDRV
jgi:hypothetical protein